MEKYKGQAFLTVLEVAEILRISKSQVYNLVNAENCMFTVVKIGRRKLVPTNDFIRWYEGLYRVEEN